MAKDNSGTDIEVEGPNYLETPEVFQYVVAIEDHVIAKAEPITLSQLRRELTEIGIYRENINLLDLGFSRIQQNPLSYRIEWSAKDEFIDHSVFNNRRHAKKASRPKVKTSIVNGYKRVDIALPE